MCRNFELLKVQAMQSIYLKNSMLENMSSRHKFWLEEEAKVFLIMDLKEVYT